MSSLPTTQRPDATAAHELPRMSALGADLLTTTRRQRWWAIMRPLCAVAGFALAAYAGHWWLTPLMMFLILVAVVTVPHDVVHESLGLTRRQTEWALFCMGAILLESGHAYRTTHLQHHRMFPEQEDPEGDPARMTFLGAVVHGVVFLPRLWLWAYRQNRYRRDQRLWLIAEATWAIAVLAVGVLIWPWAPVVFVYAGLAIVGSWVYPLLTVHLPHRNYGDTPLTQTHTLRGYVIPNFSSS